jgi:hypothetical protein
MGGISNMIWFLAISGSEFYLDDIRLYGVTADELVNP